MVDDLTPKAARGLTVGLPIGQVIEAALAISVEDAYIYSSLTRAEQPDTFASKGAIAFATFRAMLEDAGP